VHGLQLNSLALFDLSEDRIDRDVEPFALTKKTSNAIKNAFVRLFVAHRTLNSSKWLAPGALQKPAPVLRV
jgi:hypothetical protein